MKKALTFEDTKRFLKGKQKIDNGFDSWKLPIEKQTQGKRSLLDLATLMKMLTHK